MGEMNSGNGRAPRAITFPKTSGGVWTNHETGVVIRLELDGSGYRALVPSLTGRSRRAGYVGIRPAMRTLAEARNAAVSYVAMVARPAIAEAYADALAEDHLRTIDAAADAAMAVVRENDHAEALGLARAIAYFERSPRTEDDDRKDQLYAWGLAHSFMLYDDAITKDHTEALIRDEWIERSALGDLERLRLVRRTNYDALARVARELDSLQELADGGDTVSFADMRAALDDIAGLRGIRDEWAARG